jgi:pre-mRNA-splicing factor CWC22
MERERQLAERLRQKDELDAEKPKVDPKAEYEKLMNMRSGGTYIPPARLRALQAMITDKKSKVRSSLGVAMGLELVLTVS